MTAALLLALFLASAPGADALAATVAVDTLSVELRPVPGAVEWFRADPKFQYQRGGTAREGLWSRLLAWLSEHVLAPTARHVPDWLFRWLAIALALTALAFGAYHILTGRRQGLVARRESPVLDDELREHGIAGVDLDRWLREAEDAGRHRETVRVRYLITLQQLSADGALTWRIDKTNRAYVRELRQHPSAEAFTAFTELFERVWYGDRPSGTAEVLRSRDLFQMITSFRTAETNQ